MINVERFKVMVIGGISVFYSSMHLIFSLLVHDKKRSFSVGNIKAQNMHLYSCLFYVLGML